MAIKIIAVQVCNILQYCRLTNVKQICHVNLPGNLNRCAQRRMGRCYFQRSKPTAENQIEKWHRRQRTLIG